ncbi:hypothetical protein MN116_006465 [Schistosoma mekongi]|uniref:Microtubule-associated protein 9 n=1 Tax=Schistosoma mekongi TaxID=38744 RepID=A0AAE1ZB70_SCHME|nr:hypothetical protein MN116_006465 [Schistosoma mekongi]
MPISPLELLDEDYSGLFSKDYRQSNDRVNRKRPENDLHETDSLQAGVSNTHFLDTENDKNGLQNHPEFLETVAVDQNKYLHFPVSDHPENSINEDWKSVSKKQNNENMHTHKYEFNLHESTNQLTDDKYSCTEYSKLDIDDEKLMEAKENHVNNLQFNVFHDINEVNMNTTKNNSIISSNINDNMEYIEAKKSEKDTNKPSNETEPVIKPAVRTRRHISNSSKICDITLTNENDQSPINTLVISSKEQQKIINNNDKCITDIIIKSTSQSGDNVKLSPKLPMKRSKSTCPITDQRVTNRSTYQAYRKSDDCMLNAAALRELAYQSWCNRVVKSARIERMSNLRNEIDETKKEKEKLERLKSNELCFQTWKRNKHQQLIDTIKKRKEEELAQKNKLKEEQERKLNSQKAFDVWKSRKDELIMKQMRDCLSKQKLEKQSKVTEQNEKQHLSQQAFENWKSKKDALLKQQIQSKIKLQTEREKQLEEANRIKMDQAAKAYYQWELKKVVSLENLAISIDHSNKINNRRPWRPPSKTIPCTHSYRLY